MDRRICHHPVLGPCPPRKKLTFQFDENTYHAFEGETIAAALLSSGVRHLRVHEETGTPRGIYCNIGHCFECRVTVNQKPGIRACLTLVKEGMVVRSGSLLPTPLKQKGESHR
jgi:sarcosine oxidase subunit alpha